jgi:small-conductance mechanosensitive channel
MVSLRVLTLAGIYQGASAVVFWALSLWLLPQRHVAVLVGGGLMALNFVALRWLGTRAMNAENRKLAYGLALAFKLIAIMGLMAVLVLVIRIDAIGLALGLSTLFVGIGLGTAHQAFSPPQVAKSA